MAHRNLHASLHTVQLSNQHLAWLQCRWANQMPQMQPTSQPPRKHTHIYGKHTCTHINPAVIRGHNPSWLSGVEGKVASVCWLVCVCVCVCVRDNLLL